MGLLNFSGSLPVAVTLQWKGDVITNALSNGITNATAKAKIQDHVYVIANERVTAFGISVFDPAPGGPKVVSIDRQATARERFFSDKVGTYTTSPVPSTGLEQLFVLDTAAMCLLNLTFTVDSFFDLLLLQMTRVDGVLRNVANPSGSDSKAILDTFVHKVVNDKVRITYKPQSLFAAGISCKFAGKQITPNAKGPPSVKLIFDLELMTKDSIKRDLMRQLVATDWSALKDLKRNPELDLPAHAEVWFRNVKAYLLNHTDTKRAERIRGEIVLRHRGKEPAVLATDLRDDIDKHLITANHWGQKREDMTTETHQRLLSDLFGSLHQSAWHASPVAFCRTIGRVDIKLSLNQEAALVLQYGTGHCGEHAGVSFSTMCDIIRDPSNKALIVIRSGNANIDHDFVVFDLDVTNVVHTVTTNKNNSRTKKDSKDSGAGKTIILWNLKEAIAKSARPGFVLDPYLDKTIMLPDPAKLLVALHKPDRTAAGLATDFLAFDGIFPKATSSLTVTDIRFSSAAERSRLVPNI
jgi:hypothetical protein